MSTTALIVAVVALLVSLILTAQVSALRRRLARVPNDGDVVALLHSIDAELARVAAATDDLIPRVDQLEAAIPRKISRTGVVIYDAFGDIAGNLSRSVAVLNDHGDGLVITMLVGRSETRFFTKQVVSRRGVEELSPEEEEAVARAMQR